jgi:arylsulfatase A-like enzyme
MRTVTRIILLAASTAAVVIFTTASRAIAQDAGRARPNIVIVNADDLGINDLGCYGRKDHRTPHLDKLAAAGMRFTSAYCAQPICSPSRAALMTGRTPARLHLTTYLPGRPDAASQKLQHPKIRQHLLLEETTLAEGLKQAGYATACIGKWHLGGSGFEPQQQGFDVVYAGRPNTTPSATEGGKGEYDLTAAAEKFVTEHRDRPFFLYLAHNNPHIPLAAKPELIESNKDAFNPLYAAVIETLDDSVGRLLGKIDELGLREKTIFIFTSDNGGLHVPELRDDPPTHNTPFRAGKGFLYEGGLRIPLIARWPGRIKAGAVTAAPVINTDLMPTLLDLVGIKPPPSLDGRSYARLLTGGRDTAPRAFHWHFPHYNNQGGRPSGAVREGNWKLLEFYDDGKVELYNLAQDIGEQQDLAGREPKRVAAMRAGLDTWRKQIGAQENTPNANFDPAQYKRIYQDIDISQLKPNGNAAETGKSAAAWRKAMDAAVARTPKPNVLLIVADDLGYTDVGVQGGKDVPTPHIDALAASGVRCTNGYVSGVYCSPTRAALLTGRYQQRFGHEFNPHKGDPSILGLPLSETTLADRLRAAGYKTGLIGKWHLGSLEKFHPFNRGFDEFFGFLGGAHNFLDPAKTPAVQGAIYGPLTSGRESVKFDGYLTDVFAREAAAFLERHKAEPFFLFVSFNAVHTPLQAPDNYLKRVEHISDPRRRTYCAMLSAMDDAIGQVLAKLRDLKIDEKTLIFFISDNGGPTNKYAINGSRNHPLRGSKGDTWEGGVRVPFLVSWKGRLPAGKQYDRPVIQLDLAATALAAAGVEVRSEWKLDGVDLLPYLDGRNTGTPHPALFWRFGDTWAVRMGDWKIVKTWDNQEPQLFNIAEDISETVDRKGREPQRFDELSQAWKKWNSELAAPLWPLPEPVKVEEALPKK